MAALTKGMENGMKETMIAMGGADKVLVEEADVVALRRGKLRQLHRSLLRA